MPCDKYDLLSERLCKALSKNLDVTFGYRKEDETSPFCATIRSGDHGPSLWVRSGNPIDALIEALDAWEMSEKGE